MKNADLHVFNRLFVFGLIAFVSLGCMKQDAQSPPNILFIMSDDHTAQAWGTYGSVLDSVVHAPHIAQLHEEGIQLMNAFATNSICAPSRAAILTGQYSHKNGVYTLVDTLDPALPTLPEMLRQAGYQTGLVGKWHLKSRPAGFDYYNVLPGQGRYFDPVLRDSSNWPEGRSYEGFSADVIAEQSLQWLRQREEDTPFMLMTHFKATHEPFNYPPRFDTLYQDVTMPEPSHLYNYYPEQSTRTFEGQVLEILGGRFEQNPGRYSAESFSLDGLDRRQARSKIYQKFVKDFLRSGAAIDQNIGRLLEYLDRQGLAENTMVIYTSDQGYFMGEHGLFDKRIMYEQSARMPVVIRWPGQVPAGATNRDLILNTDFAPTLLDVAGLPVPPSMQGRSFRAILSGQTPDDWREAFYYRYWMHQQHRPAHMGIRTERYKLIWFYGQPLRDVYGEPPTKPTWEFYDLERDPKEINNAYDDSRYREVIQRMKRQLLEHKDSLNDNDTGYPVMQPLLWDS
ncbi:MAG: sulfatase [Balneolaceae bacterium]|nr:sulfatase [Balneolaceae bacterium]